MIIELFPLTKLKAYYESIRALFINGGMTQMLNIKGLSIYDSACQIPMFFVQWQYFFDESPFNLYMF
ncbi:hypothetical protein HZS_331 [Henneguya salminicola]|nr:hypothetical protein HZS_331 [Henneguya salminicola]